MRFAILLLFALTSCQSVPLLSKKEPEPKVVFKPLITIKNTLPQKAMVGFQGPETRFITVPANSTRELNLKSGTYKWAFASKNAATISGYRTFEVNQRYDWNPLLD